MTVHHFKRRFQLEIKTSREKTMQEEAKTTWVTPLGFHTSCLMCSYINGPKSSSEKKVWTRYLNHMKALTSPITARCLYSAPYRQLHGKHQPLLSSFYFTQVEQAKIHFSFLLLMKCRQSGCFWLLQPNSASEMQWVATRRRRMWTSEQDVWED